jgi:hypothetical protein
MNWFRESTIGKERVDGSHHLSLHVGVFVYEAAFGLLLP